MKNKINRYTYRLFAVSCLFTGLFWLNSCEKGLDYVSYGELNNVVMTPEGIGAALNTAYTGLVGGTDWQGGWTSASNSWRAQNFLSTDEGTCSWGGDWQRMPELNFTPDFAWVTDHYSRYLAFISRITITLDNAENVSMDANFKKRYIGELKALRANYAMMLYFAYGPLTIITDPKVAADPYATPVPRPTSAQMVKQIEEDYLAAAAVLPDKWTGENYGRFSKAAALTGLMKVYMHEKQWDKAVDAGNQIKAMGYALQTNYQDLFNINNKGGTSPEIILPIICTATGGDQYTNMWLAHALPSDYKDPSGIPLTAWGGYKMRWTAYDKFDKRDKRLSVVLEKYPTGRNADGTIIYKDARASGELGAIPMKFAPDPSKTNSQNSAVDFVVYRYADVLLMLAESINEDKGGPTDAAYEAINLVRQRAGLPDLPAGLSKSQFLEKVQDERLFELWAEGWRRDDLIRWGLYIKRAIDRGSIFAKPEFVLYPLPRAAINQSNGVIKQNPGYN
ncbi:RagB/SusD family nutrient uptake outer membrane protein [Sphingobacterium spiritivorum]|uniref:RagB/SusD family nutrient uptake outer membrane protein n=1 Tax=Sphingobacterium spiritivorum TaxID=258 RepID=UPI001918DC3B|nr:RagB/SusD family nutrient uptake outer membrane protein [Sphingobacterium spiritivorum]QQT25530.1 RagB/SusD family nutrient uptake outer membrane protein [Sphingobacterium spiritivorum]